MDNNIIDLRNQNVPLVISILMAVKSYIKSFFLLFLVLLSVFHYSSFSSIMEHPKEAQGLRPRQMPFLWSGKKN